MNEIKEAFQSYKKENPNADEASFYNGMLYLASLYVISMQETDCNSNSTANIILYSVKETNKLLEEIEK